MMEDSLAEDRHSPVPGLVHRYPDRVLMLVTTQCASLLPLLHAVADRRRPDPELQLASDHEAQLEYLRRTPQVRDVLISRRRRPDARPEALRVDPPRPPRDPPHRDHPDRLAGAGLPAAADRRRALRDARAVPPALDQPPLQPPERDHARGLARGRQADEGRAAGRQPVASCSPASTTASTSSGRSSTGSSRTGSGRTTSTSATWSRAPATSGRRSARASRSWRACAATPPATRSRRT